MKKLGLLMMLLLLSRIALFCQAQTAGIEEKEVLRNEDVIFHQIDEHTWFGTGHLMANESLYLVEGETKAILIDAIQARLSIISRRFISIRLIR